MKIKKQQKELAVYTVVLTKERHSRTVDIVGCAMALTLKIFTKLNKQQQQQLPDLVVFNLSAPVKIIKLYVLGIIFALLILAFCLS